MDEAVVRIVLQDEAGGGGAPGAAPSPHVFRDLPPLPQPAQHNPAPQQRTAPANPQGQAAAPSPRAASATTPPPSQVNKTSEAVFADTQAALVSLGKSAKEAEQVVAGLRQSKQAYASVQDAIVASYQKQPADPPQPAAAPPTGQPQQPQPGAAAAAGPPPSSFDPVEEAKKRRDREQKLQQVETEYQRLFPGTAATFDAAAEAKKRLESDRQRAAVEAEYAKLVPVAPQFDPAKEAERRLEADKRRAAVDAEYAKLSPPAATFDPAAEAAKWLEKDKQRLAVETEYEKLAPAQVEVFDPAAEARKRVEQEDRRAQVEAEYQKVRPDAPAPAFDPRQQAAEQFEGEVKKEQIRAAYDSMYGSVEQTKGAFDATLDVAQKMRGTVGGMFGALVGAVLDVTAAVRDARKREPTSPAAAEAKRRNADLPAPQAAPGAQQVKPAADVYKVIESSAPARPVAAQPSAPPGAANAATRAAPEAGAQAAGGGEAGAAAGMGGAAIVGVVAIAAVMIASAVKDAIESAVGRYAQYSPQASQAQAMAEVNTTLNDMRRAQELGSGMSDYITAQNSLENAIEDLKTGLLSKIMPIAAKLMGLFEKLLPIVEVGLLPLTLILDAVNAILSIFESQQARDALANFDPTTIFMLGPLDPGQQGPGVQVPAV